MRPYKLLVPGSGFCHILSAVQKDIDLNESLQSNIVVRVQLPERCYITIGNDMSVIQ